MELTNERKGAIIVITVIINLIFLPLLFISAGGFVKKLKMDGMVYANDVIFEEIYHEGYFDSEDDYVAPYTSYKPTYFYTVDGKSYSYTPYRTSESKASLANANKIYYDKSNPANCVAENETEVESFLAILIFYLVFMAIILSFYSNVAISSKKETKNKLPKAYRDLEQNGTFISDLEYELIDSGVIKNSVILPAILIELKLVSGETVKLVSEPKEKVGPEIPMIGKGVEAVVDFSDLTKYYIDFDVYNKRGGKPRNIYPVIKK